MDECRRSSTRLEVNLLCVITVAEAERECAIANLSLGGAQIMKPSSVAIAMHDRVRLAFALPTINESIEVESIVRWVARELVGLQFDGLRAREVWALNQFFKGIDRAA